MLIEPLLANKGYVQNERFEQQFDDCDDSSVALLKHFGIVSGTSENIFEPERHITREEAAAIIYRLCVFSDILSESEYECKYTYNDDDSISDWAKITIYTLYSSGIMTGMDNERFVPNEYYTIEQAIKTLSDVYKMMPACITYINAESKGTMLRGNTEHIINQWENGYYEIQYNDTVYISPSASSSDAVLSFKAEDCDGMKGGEVNGTAYIAVNKPDDTCIIYNMPDGQELFSIPYRVKFFSGEYIITFIEKPSTDTPKTTLFGVYSADGTEILQPEYTIDEIIEKGYYDRISTGGSSGSSSSNTQQTSEIIIDVFDNNYPEYGIRLVGCGAHQINGIIYIPVLKFANSIGFNIISDDAGSDISFSAYGKTILFDAESAYALNSNEPYIPAEELAEAVGYTLNFDPDKNLLTFIQTR